jgi:LAO/AO transport system kinase
LRSRLLPAEREERPLPELARRLLARDRDAVADALNLADDRRPARRAEAVALLDALERTAPLPGGARIGITGAPGAGKSTLLDALVRRLRPRGETVAIVAVDPSSPRTGGALLGDRVRVRSGASDPGVFIRSMAARDRLGGLADATRAGVVILGCVFDRVFVETVGVGQSEVEVAALVDTLVYVADPGSGDLLQFMKAGVLEAPDLYAVNKADLGPASARTAAELASGLGLGRSAAEPEPPVLVLSARDGTGIDALIDAIDAHRGRLLATDTLPARRRRGRDAWVVETLEQEYGRYGIARVGGATAIARRLGERPDASSFALVAELGREIEDALRKPS